MYQFQNMPANNSCKWCGSSLSDGYDHRLCKAWRIWKLKDWVDKTEDMLLIMYNVIDFLEAQPN
jgi:hypothetical protein